MLSIYGHAVLKDMAKSLLREGFDNNALDALEMIQYIVLQSSLGDVFQTSLKGVKHLNGIDLSERRARD